jgi:hypothetical protein
VKLHVWLPIRQSWLVFGEYDKPLCFSPQPVVCSSAGECSGSEKETVVPCPSALSTQMEPECRLMKAAEIYKPNPSPG